MALPDAVAPRWPHTRPGRGHYESYFLRACHPTEPRGIWIRYTVLTPPDGRPSGALWFTLFDRAAPAGPVAVRVAAGEPIAGSDAWIKIADSSFGDPEVVGAARSERCSATWALRHRSEELPLHHLPRPWMYTARLPRTKLLSPRPAAVFDGELDVNGERILVAGWRGMVGHNWGEGHAERWVWLHGLGFVGAGTDTWLDVAIGRVRLGPVTTPWVANGALSLAGMRLPLGGLGRRVAITAAQDACELRLTGAGVAVAATVSAPPGDVVAWDYADPDGTTHRVVNCSVADLRLRVDRAGRDPVELDTGGRAAYELGRR